MTFVARLFRRRPAAATIDLASPSVARNPYPHYERLRRDGPVQLLPREGAWIVLGYDEVQSALAQPSVLSNALYVEVDDVLLGADPPAHSHARRVLSRYFAVERVEALVRYAEKSAAALLRPRMDVVADYANVLSASVAGRLVGFDSEAMNRLRVAAGDAQRRDLTGYLAAITAAAERTPVFAELRAEGFDERESRSLVRLLWLAATTTTERVIAHCVYRLLLHPEARDPSVAGSFVHEVLRLHPGELIVPRLAKEEISLGAARIPAGAVIYLCIAAANRDPAKFDRPAELRLDRPLERILTFGFGIHHCIGSILGRQVIEVAVRTLLNRFPHFRAAHRLDDLVGWCSKTASPIARLVIEGEE